MKLAPTLYGHRGSRGTHVENSMPSFAEALASGVDGVEIDLQLTKDGTPVVYHDPHLTGKLCSGPNGLPLETPISIAGLSLEALKEFRIGDILNPRFPDQVKTPDQNIPTFQEFCDWVKPTKLIALIEIKYDAPESERLPPGKYVEPICELIDKCGLWNKSIVQSFSPEIMKALHARNPKGRYAQIYPKQDDFAELAVKDVFPMVTVDFTAVTGDHRKLLRQRNIALLTYTPNTQSDWEKLIALEVDGIITDYPRRLKDLLATKKS